MRISSFWLEQYTWKMCATWHTLGREAALRREDVISLRRFEFELHLGVKMEMSVSKLYSSHERTELQSYLCESSAPRW